MTARKRFYDDPEIGPARSTSHPRFLALATDDFFYDCTDDFAPFGSDMGADTLSALEEWYQDGGADRDIDSLLGDLIDEWLPDLPDLSELPEAEREAWMAEPRNQPDLRAACQVWIACALGQLKIAGTVSPIVRSGALTSLGCLLDLNAPAKGDSAAEERGKLRRMESVLQAT